MICSDYIKLIKTPTTPNYCNRIPSFDRNNPIMWWERKILLKKNLEPVDLYIYNSRISFLNYSKICRLMYHAIEYFKLEIKKSLFLSINTSY